MPHPDHWDQELNLLSRNEQFLRKVRETVESNLSNEQFGVENLADSMAMSRIQLYRKLHKLIGKNISQYIREIRLAKAMIMLQQNVASVSEIAYQVGFNSPAYFNKCFHDHYGYPPGEVIKTQACEENKLNKNVEINENDRNPIKSEKWIFFIIPSFIFLLFIIGFLLVKQASIRTRPVKEKGVAVLPFHNDSPDPDNEYFCKAIMDDILNHLAKIKDLQVMSRTDVEPYRKSSKTRNEIANELGVENLLEGSVRKQGNRFKISLQLINAQTGLHLWSDSYEGEYTEEIFTVQSNIAKQVASALKAVITPEEEERIEKKPTVDITAYDFMIKGRDEIENYWRTYDTKYLRLAHKLLDRALEIDPQYLEAIAYKGGAFVAGRNFDSAYVYAKRVLEIDPESSIGYHLMGSYHQFKSEHDPAIENRKLAVEHFKQGDQVRIKWEEFEIGFLYCISKSDFLNGLSYIQNGFDNKADNLAAQYILLSNVFMELGDYERAEMYNKKMFELEPEFSQYYIENQKDILFLQGKFIQAVNFLDSINSLTIREILCNRFLFHANVYLGYYDKAEQYYNQLLDLGGRPVIWDSIYLGFMYRKLGREQDVDEILNSIHNYLENRLVKCRCDFVLYNLSVIHAILNEKEESLKYLSEAADLGQGSSWFDFLDYNPMLENLWDDPEFKIIVRGGQEKIETVRTKVMKMRKRGELSL